MAAATVILVDTDVLIAHLRGIPAASAWLMAARSQIGPLAVSVVSVIELEGGMRSAERRALSTLLSALRPVDVDLVIARRAAEYMRKYRASHSGIGLGDYAIAATAETGGYELGTLNVRHFPMFPDLQPPFAVSDR